MGKRKTARKKKSEYKKYKEYIKKLKATEKALFQVRQVVESIVSLTKMKTQQASNFAIGGVVKNDKYSEVTSDDIIHINTYSNRRKYEEVYTEEKKWLTKNT